MATFASDATQPLGAPLMLASAACFRVERDTPKEGVTFYSMQPLLSSPALRQEVTRRLVARVRALGVGFTHVAGLETRGYFPALWLADALSLPFVPVRKLAQARRIVRSDAALWISTPYGTEYAQVDDASRLCVERDALPAGAIVCACDDVYATGGSLVAARSCLEQAEGARVAACVVLVELAGVERCAGAPDVVALFSAAADGTLSDVAAPTAPLSPDALRAEFARQVAARTLSDDDLCECVNLALCAEVAEMAHKADRATTQFAGVCVHESHMKAQFDAVARSRGVESVYAPLPTYIARVVADRFLPLYIVSTSYFDHGTTCMHRFTLKS